MTSESGQGRRGRQRARQAPAGDVDGWGSADGYTLDRLAELIEEERAAKNRVEEATAAVAQLLHRLHEIGYQWQTLADAAGLSNDEQARWRAQRARDTSTLPPSLARHFRLPDAPPRVANDAVAGPGVSISRAAEMLGVTRQTVYNRIRSGALETVVDERGRTRVIVNAKGSPASPSE